MAFENVAYSAFIKRESKGYGVYFPLLQNYGYEIPLSSGRTKKEAIQNARKDLAYFLAGVLYDNEDLPKDEPIHLNCATEEMESILICTSYSNYAKEIEEHLPGRHWHIDFNRDSDSDFKGVAYKNEQGLWEVREDGIPIEVDQNKLLHICPTYPVICMVRTRGEAEKAFDSFVRKLQEI